MGQFTVYNQGVLGMPNIPHRTVGLAPSGRTSHSRSRSRITHQPTHCGPQLIAHRTAHGCVAHHMTTTLQKICWLPASGLWSMAPLASASDVRPAASALWPRTSVQPLASDLCPASVKPLASHWPKIAHHWQIQGSRIMPHA